MKLLLDTHVWIWSQEAVERLGTRATASLTDLGEPNFVSAISTLEIALLIARGLLRFQRAFPVWQADSLRELQGATLDVTHEIAWEAYNLPGTFHNDPADRVLVASARVMGLTLVTADDLILRYRHVKSLDARQ
ncbi:MAG: type II toxin-antitoxin system VapC family toxin [Chthoniobacterales bacterium]